MKNIFLFIRIYFNFILFLILQITCIVFLVRNSNTHEAAYSEIAGEVTGRINVQYDKVHSFFNLKENNRQLQEENTRLKNLMGINFENADTAIIKRIDNLYTDTLLKQRKFIWLSAKVVNNSISQQFNFITLHRGKNQGVKKDMAVVGPQGIVGTVVSVSDNFCRAMSLLHQYNKVSAMLKKSEIPGTVGWDGADPRYLTLNNIPKSALVSKGDSIMTSNYSSNFPPNLLIGRVEEIAKDPGSNYFIIKVKSATNFYSLEYAYLVDNLQLEEQRRLEAAKVKNE